MSASAVVRSHLRHAITATGELDVTGQAHRAERKVPTARSLHPDVGVRDVWLSEHDGMKPTAAAEKLAPRLPSGFVARPRLIGLFNDGTPRALTVVSAGPGWGKTLAAAEWAADTSAHVAWVSLDDGDGEPAQFWSDVLTAVRGTGAVPPDNPLTGLVPGRVDAAIIRLIAEGLRQLPASVVLVLDDMHEISRSAVLDGINALLRHPIPQLRLILLTRSDPTLALHRLRLRGDVAEIRAADLAFTADEAAAMFALDGFDVASLPLDRLLERTEGWAAGLRFVALALRRHPAAEAMEEFATGDRAIADYLTDEVLAGLPPRLRTFLLHTSVAERINGPLADMLTGEQGGGRHLEQLVNANAFVVSLGTADCWYRYHPMLRTVLRQQLAMTESGLIGTLHRRASRWFAVHGSPIEAMQHAAAAEDWGLLGRVLVERAAPALVSTDQAAMAKIFAQVAQPGDPASADVHLCAAARLFIVGQYAAMEPHLMLAREALPELDAEIQPAADVLVHLLEHTVARIHADTDAMIAHSSRALELLHGAAASVPIVDEYTAIATGLHGAGLLWSGAFRAAEWSLAEGLAALEGSGGELARISMLGHLGLVSTLKGQLRQAVGFATAAIDLAGSRGWSTVEQVSAAHLALALVNFRWNQLDEAEGSCGLALRPTLTGCQQPPFGSCKYG
jgi:LuxR family transcriptional regulator, maltose regulon positive regulatory protein